MREFIEFAKNHPKILKAVNEYNGKRRALDALSNIKYDAGAYSELMDLQRKIGEEQRDAIGDLEEAIPIVFMEYVRQIIHSEMMNE